MFFNLFVLASILALSEQFKLWGISKSDPVSTDDNSSLLVNTASGPVMGMPVYVQRTLFNKMRVNAWLGIPYAQPPVGNLRFKRPQPAQNWTDVLNTTQWPNRCYQLHASSNKKHGKNASMSEDCLYLNIWAPSPTPTSPLPVLVLFYGTDFNGGSSYTHNPSMLVAETNLIVVSVQYRLSIFGFLYLNSSNAPGNQGLLDQALALQWIKDNIRNFGGDCSRITLFGEGAGAASVSFHLLSPLTMSLFNNAIMDSGSSLAPWALLSQSQAQNMSITVLNNLGCTGSDVGNLIQCAINLNNATAVIGNLETYLALQNRANGGGLYVFLPVVDGYFLTDQPINLLNQGAFKKTSIMTGANKDEGNVFMLRYGFAEYFNLSAMPCLDYPTFQNYLSNLFNYYPSYPTLTTNLTKEGILYRYSHWPNVENRVANYHSLGQAFTDSQILCPVIRFADYYANDHQKVFMYHFTQVSSKSMWPKWFGATHGDELPFFLGETLHASSTHSEEEKTLTRQMLKYWSNFARYGNPNGGYIKDCTTCALIQLVHDALTPGLIKWPKYEIENSPYSDLQRAYIIFNANKLGVDFNLRAEYCAFWHNYLPKATCS